MIISRQNTLIKKVRSLSDKKARDNYGEYIVESIKAVKEVLSSSHLVELILATEKGINLLGNTDAKVELVSDDVFKSITTEVSPQGVLAVVKKPTFNIAKPMGNCLFLDEVSDPSNIGAILRTAAASGYNEVYMADCADPFNPKAVRSSMGGLFKVKFYQGKRSDIIKFIDCPFVIADMFGDNVFKKAEFKNKKFCLVIGNEANGVSKELKSLASHTVSIPMENGMESLNAAVSAGILMYALKSDIGE